jgi:hypothetical protein
MLLMIAEIKHDDGDGDDDISVIFVYLHANSRNERPIKQ